MRAAAVEATRDRILEVACEAFRSEWYEDVTVRAIAEQAGVALQTVLNHFRTKEELCAAALERSGDRIERARFSVEPGDLDAAVALLVDDYEDNGDATIRNLAVEDRFPAVRASIARGRAGHAKWVQHAFPEALRGLRGAARERRAAQLIAVTDVYTWKLFRRDRGLDRDQTVLAMAELVRALHDRP